MRRIDSSISSGGYIRDVTLSNPIQLSSGKRYLISPVGLFGNIEQTKTASVTSNASYTMQILLWDSSKTLAYDSTAVIIGEAEIANHFVAALGQFPPVDGIYRKVIPAQDVDIVSFRYVDYHGSVSQQSSAPVLLDDTYTIMKSIADGSWTLGDSDQTKIDGTHYVHEFTFTTPVHLTANTAYWFMVGGNLSNQGDDWLITYQAPSISNDLLLVKNMYNVNQWIIPNSGEFQSAKPGMYLRLSNGTDTWTI